ncbi:DUF2079 domain-containing protein [Sphingomonas sp. MG17]|uniref:DUF2079 domain-containing protein n=1 Tax=Sphingomonas tagetis TaxID=2949092 RepID=A0A9X2HLM7_9SPHN|nr:DUF2079 domain-containing protein [Sphingomonas tagetis]MCP3731917.1 DUF2079 domain-containing protein [Sphingomonas tagetis]
MTRPHPIWLASPSRFAALPRAQARIVIGALLALLLASFAVLGVNAPAESDTGAGVDRPTDIALYEGIVSAVRHGEDYYTAAADALRAGSYPLRPFLTFRMPGLATVQGLLPELVALALLYLLATTTALLWHRRLGEALTGVPARVAALFLLAGGMLAFVQPGLVAFHEIWAGLLVATSLALRRPGRWIEAVAVALIAMLVRETAALFVLVMGGLALLEGHRREAMGWAVALGIFALALAAHAVAVHGVTGPLDAASPGWSGMHGFGLFVRAMTLATALQLFPAIAAALLVALALFGWASWRDPLALRAITTFSAYAAAISLFARLDTFYWGLMIAPVFLVGLAFVPDGLRDLTARALDRRRVRVQRIEP